MTGAEPASAVSVSVIGFDSAWTDNPKAPGAICIIRVDAEGARLHLEPRLASFSEATQTILHERREVAKCLVALDQPTIVPNAAGSRPVDKVAGSLISWVGGGVQPANRSKLGMFDDDAPIWRFKRALCASDDPELARVATEGLFLIEVFPALALVALDLTFCRRLGAPKYNPANCKKFKIEHWQSVTEAVTRFGALRTLQELELRSSIASATLKPAKADQDKMDAMICALIGLHWLMATRQDSLMIGDLLSGYLVTPATDVVRDRLQKAASVRSVPCC